MLYNVVLASIVQQSESAIHIHISPSFGFPSHLCHHSTLSRVPCIIQYIIINYFNSLNTYIYIFYMHTNFKSLSIMPIV